MGAGERAPCARVAAGAAGVASMCPHGSGSDRRLLSQPHTIKMTSPDRCGSRSFAAPGYLFFFVSHREHCLKMNEFRQSIESSYQCAIHHA